MDKRELARISCLYQENLSNAESIGLATIATVVDVLRADSKKNKEIVSVAEALLENEREETNRRIKDMARMFSDKTAKLREVCGKLNDAVFRVILRYGNDGEEMQKLAQCSDECRDIIAAMPIESEESNEKKELPTVPLSVLHSQDPALYSALFSIGCENLNDIEGYRENITDDSHKVIEIMIGGRFAALPEEIGSGEMMTLAKVMEENGLPPLSRWSK